MSVKNPMYRYLMKYVGTYRVLPILDVSTGDFPKDHEGNIDETYDDIYIPCNKGIIKHTYEPYYLVWYTDRIGLGRNVKREFDNANIPVYNYEETDSEVFLWFEDSYMKKVAKIVKPKTNKKNVSPFSVVNITGGKVFSGIPDDELILFNSITDGLDKIQKMQFSRVVIKEFDTIIKSKKGKKYDVKTERDNSGLKGKEFIYYIGLWKEFIKFAKKKYEELYN